MADEHQVAAGLADHSLLDAQTVDILMRLERDPFLDPTMAPSDMRAAFDAFYASLPIAAPPIGAADDVTIDGPAGPIALRIYRPRTAVGEKPPVILFIHGGGAMMGGLASYDGVCRRLTAKSGAMLISATYRLAPEHKFPAATDDIWAVFNWVCANAAALGGDVERLVVMGESGGGGLAAGCAQRARDEGQTSIALQVLINPALGMLGSSKSMARYARGFFFEPEALEWIYSQYLENSTDITNPLVSPILAPDLAGLPPTFIITAGHDILRDDIEAYAARLADAGVRVEISCYETTIHGFTVMAGAIDAGLDALDECAEKIRARFDLATPPE
ncbi:alpha/beta hydrolase [Sphingomonas sp. So64.6b]|uniref:alpha/beta hydrolase n=1 Tax=Sphingomonas sp. So64.6b TaxID=2997354 RepID=UPI001603CC0F|nr:alpha/beta hydrolase [Sphingomonas sp. So64.6b]QNA85443.1 alpha/beta hydrolase [Sphingomonas sp. So64.6b]